MNLEVENFTFSETCPGALKAKEGTPSADNCFVNDSLNLVLPEPGIPETMMILLFPWGSPTFIFSTKSYV